MKKIFNLIVMGIVLVSMNSNAQTYVNEMSQEEVERDCYIEGSAVYGWDNIYNDGSFVQRASSDRAVSFIFNRELWNDKNLTGYRINLLLPSDRPDISKYILVEYSKDEETYEEVQDMVAERSYEPSLGAEYWMDHWLQGPLPEGVKEIKVTLLPVEADAAWIAGLRRVEIYYEGGSPYEYVEPPYVMKTLTDFSIDFESEDCVADMGGSQNSTSSVEVVDNPVKDAVNSSDKVLKITQDPTDSNWGWGNADWFGVAVGYNSANLDFKFTETGRYLHISVLREGDSLFGVETWGGTANYKNAEVAYVGSTSWQEIIIDMNDYMDMTFKQIYFSPNERFGTDNINVAEVTYIDNIYISEISSPSGNIDNIAMSDVKVWGGSGEITVSGNVAENVYVYSVSGVCLGVYDMSDGLCHIAVDAGLYFVKVGKTTSKVIVY